MLFGDEMEVMAWAQISAVAGVAIVSRTKESLLLVRALIFRPQSGSCCFGHQYLPFYVSR
jgi:hypothetical protein